MASDPTTTDEANARGYTCPVIIEGEGLGIGIDAFLKPHEKTEGLFRAFDCNHQKMVSLDGASVTVRDNA